MNLDKLKPAWIQFKLESSMCGISSDHISKIIETQEKATGITGKRVIVSTLMFVFLTICCQGG